MRIYLDNAATSWPKPEAVYQAVERYQRELGAPAGRSAYVEAFEVERAVRDARVRIAQLLDVTEPQRIVFTANGTDALNLAIHGMVRAGDHVVTTVCEHNSVLRPLRHLEERAGVSVSRVGCDSEGIVDPAAVGRALRPETTLVAVVFASNVTGALQPVEEISKRLKGHNAFLLVDAAQVLGHIPISIPEIEADLVAAPGHKGLLGPLGTGLLYVGPRVEERLESLRQGGTGTHSDEDRQPSTLPDKYESGNHNVPGILGLAAGVGYLLEQGVDGLHREIQRLTSQLLDGLSNLPGLSIVGPTRIDRRVGVVSVQSKDYDPQELAASLDAANGIKVRAGIHCAPRMHAELNTLTSGGTVRFSLGPFTTDQEIEITIGTVRDIVGG